MRFTIIGNALLTTLSSLILSTSSMIIVNTSSVVWAVAGGSLYNDYDVKPVEYVDTNNGQDLPLLGYISIPQSVIDDESEKVPAVLILPDWDNVNEYEVIRATMINEEFGWIGFVADLYGEDMHDVQDFDVKVEQATKYRSNPELFNGRVQAAIDTLKENPNVDSSKIAIIGYCLGGTGVLSYSFADTNATSSDIVGAISFHGGLLDFEVQGSMQNPVLVLSGGDDDTGTAVEDLESRLVEANSTWQITRYSGIQHGFTVFDTPAYNEWVDHRSWNEMSTFLMEVFNEIEYGTKPPIVDIDYHVTDSDSDIAIGTAVERTNTMNDTAMDATATVAVETIMYDDNGFPLEGYLAMPMAMAMMEGEGGDAIAKQLYPAVVIVPGWDGVNGPTGYKSERAVMMAKEGPYIAMVADIYGIEYTNVEDFQMKIELSTKYRNDPTLFVSRIQAAINMLVDHPNVDTTQIFVAGYCFGGTGSIDYAFSNSSSNSAFEGVKAVVPIHGGLSPLRPIQTSDVEPYILILSGGVDDAHGNTTELEMHLDSTDATWEITRYSNAQHGFTQWGTSAYQEMADSRSWWSMMSLFRDLITLSDGDDEAMVVDGTNDDGDDDDGDDGNDSSASSSEKILLYSISTVAVAVAATVLL